MPAEARRGARAARTRAEILAAAEALFAERGFGETRLEDVAERVGVRRAALFYHFHDKRALYDAVLEDLLGSLLARVEAALARPGRPLADALESAISIWVEYVWERPATAHILLREVSNRGERSETLRRFVGPGVQLLRRVFDEGRRTGAFRPVAADPFHFVSTVVGSTIFFVAGMPSLFPELPFDPLSREQMEAHRADTLRVTRRLLGLGGPRPATG